MDGFRSKVVEIAAKLEMHLLEVEEAAPLGERPGNWDENFEDMALPQRFVFGWFEMKALKVIGILLAGPIIGFLLGALGFSLTLPPDPTPGDGIVVMPFGFVTAFLFLIVSIYFAIKIWDKSSHELRSESK